MKLKDAEGWTKARAANTDPYSNAVMEYAEEWADAMERKLKADPTLTVAVVARPCEPKGHGITGFQYGCAVATLRDVWERGAELNAWHNGEYGLPNAEGTVNPAILVLKDGGGE